MSDQTNEPPAAHPEPEAPTASPTTASPSNGTPPAAAVPVQPQTALSFVPRDTGEMFRYAKFIANAEIIPKSLQRKPHNVLLVLLKGQELGLKPMQAIGNINVVEGKAEVGSHLMLAMVLQRSDVCEYFLPEDCDDESATYVTRRRGWPEGREAKVTWSIERAKTAGLWDKGRDERARANNNWKRMPGTMCKRRAQAELARDIYPDVVLGLYDHGELTELGLTTDQVTGAIDIVAPGAEPSRSAGLKDRMRSKVESGRAEDVVSGTPGDDDPDWMKVPAEEPETDELAVEAEPAPAEPEEDLEDPDQPRPRPPEDWTRDEVVARADELGIVTKAKTTKKLIERILEREPGVVLDKEGTYIVDANQEDGSLTVVEGPMSDEEKAAIEEEEREADGQLDLGGGK